MSPSKIVNGASLGPHSRAPPKKIVLLLDGFGSPRRAAIPSKYAAI